MKIKNLIFRVLLLSLFSFIIIGCNKDEDDPIPTEKKYVGSEKCASCHTTTHANFVESGHPYKVMKVTGGIMPKIPFLNVSVPAPDGYDWSKISYTIGGFGWKMRFVDLKGYVITQVAGSQWNPEDNSRSVYNATIPVGTEKYTCGNCHTTGWKSVADGGTKQDGLEGMDGEFFAGGVHCEACHGMGNIHVATKKASDIVKDASGDLCAKCHWRRYASGDLKQQTSGGWEMHRNQHEQLSTNAHSKNGMNCNTCHDPHASTKHDDLAKGMGIKKQCSACHTGAKYTNVHMNATCVDCHMPHTAKNGIAKHKYRGDAPNHNFKINTSETDTYLTKDANNVAWANVGGKGTTLDFACYKCHQDDAGIGGTSSKKTRAQLTAKAITFHK